MNKQKVLEILKENKTLLQKKYDVDSLSLFGSTARDTATETSDIDILISFREKPNSNKYFGVLFHLEDLLKSPIDLVTTSALRPELKAQIEAEKIDI